MYKQVLIPDENNSYIDLPKRFFGKKVEVIVVEIGDLPLNDYPQPPAGKKTTISELLENFGEAPDFPTIDEIRDKAWPAKW